MLRALAGFAAELRGAVNDHRNWIESPRAQLLAASFRVSGRGFTYGAYAALAWLAYMGWLTLRADIATQAYGAPISYGDSPQVALFVIFAVGLLGPILAIGTWIAVGLVYNMTVDRAFRILPRFARPMVHPAIIWALFAVLASQQELVVDQIGRTVVNAKATVIAALPGSRPDDELHAAEPGAEDGRLQQLRLKLAERFHCEVDDVGVRRCTPREEPAPGL